MGLVSIAILLFLISSCWGGSDDDQLVPGKPLSPGSAIVSKGGVFAFGFFPLGGSNSSTRLYVGIWYNNIPNRTVVWVANRNSPIMNQSSVLLSLTDQGGLVVSDSLGGTLWKMNNNKNIAGGGTRSSAAVLLNTGNLVIQSLDGTIMWESFDRPTDTFLPGMKIWLLRNDHIAVEPFISWKSPDDPSNGDSSLGSSLKPYPQLFAWHGFNPYWRGSGSTWNGPVLKSFLWYLALIRDRNYSYLMISTSYSSTSVRFVLDSSGKVQFLSWDSGRSLWAVQYILSVQGCDRYGSCGPFGYCDMTGVRTCKCLDGFEPVSSNSLQGCQRKEEMRCDGHERFLLLPSMKLPDKFAYIGGISFEECTVLCSRNCSCTAYAYNNSTSLLPPQCLVWMGELIDTAKLSENGENLYLRLASSVVGINFGKSKGRIMEIVLPVASSLLMLLCLWLVWICNCKGKQENREISKRQMQRALSVSDGLGETKVEFPVISFREITVATQYFADSNILGRGGFGNVYKGTLEGGTEIAVKRLNKSSGQGLEEFRNEVILIAKLQHRNLVKLLGCCTHGEEKILIYEYLPNKSLDAFIFNDARKSMLDWPTRFKIIKGVAQGLLYLHQDSRLTVVHRDLKASNILLDADMSPKISDFGMARIFGSAQQQANTNRLVGTYGYMSPEYALEGTFSVKSDIYSFGVLLLEIVSGLKISHPHRITDFPNLIAFAWSSWKDQNTKDLVDSSISGSCSLDEISRCIHLGLLCVQDNPNSRPLMSWIVFNLENGATTLPAPKQPVYYAQRNCDTDGVAKINSVNPMSFTVLDGR